MNSNSIRKFATAQAFEFWLMLGIGLIMISIAKNDSSQFFSFLFWTQLALWVIFIFTSTLLASAVKKSPIVWFAIPIFLGPLGLVLAYAMLSSTAKKLLTTNRWQDTSSTLKL